MIEKAMEAEQQYLEAKLSGQEAALNLSEYGYESLEKYFYDKKEYQLQHCGLVLHEPTMATVMDEFIESVKQQNPSIWIPTADSVFVWHGDDTIDEDLCKELGVKIYQMPDFVGGNIISGPSDFSMTVSIPASIDITTEYMLEKMKGIMDKYIDGIIIDGNDFMLNDRKVMGVMNLRANGMYMFATHVSYVDYTDYINQICQKPAQKTPGFIDESALPRDTLKNEVLEWLHYI